MSIAVEISYLIPADAIGVAVRFRHQFVVVIGRSLRQDPVPRRPNSAGPAHPIMLIQDAHRRLVPSDQPTAGDGDVGRRRPHGPGRIFPRHPIEMGTVNRTCLSQIMLPRAKAGYLMSADARRVAVALRHQDIVGVLGVFGQVRFGRRHIRAGPAHRVTLATYLHRAFLPRNQAGVGDGHVSGRRGRRAGRRVRGRLPVVYDGAIGTPQVEFRRGNVGVGPPAGHPARGGDGAGMVLPRRYRSEVGVSVFERNGGLAKVPYTVVGIDTKTTDALALGDAAGVVTACGYIGERLIGQVRRHSALPKAVIPPAFQLPFELVILTIEDAAVVMTAGCKRLEGSVRQLRRHGVLTNTVSPRRGAPAFHQGQGSGRSARLVWRRYARGWRRRGRRWRRLYRWV